MFYRARVDLAFDNIKEANKSIEKALDMLPFAKTINRDQVTEESPLIIIELCFHDEDPSKPCVVLFQEPSIT